MIILKSGHKVNYSHVKLFSLQTQVFGYEGNLQTQVVMLQMLGVSGVVHLQQPLWAGLALQYTVYHNILRD